MAPRLSAFSVAAALLLCTYPDHTYGDLAAPGDGNYWVKLKSLAASEGKMEPAFTEDGTDFKLVIDNNEIKSVRLTFELNLPKYDPMQIPKLYWNGEEYKYSPVDTLTQKIMLDDSIGPVDKVYSIKVADPSGASGWPIPQETAHEYKVHILQPPSFEEVIEAVGIQAFTADDSKAKVPQKPAFHAQTKAYHFTLPKGHDQVRVQMNCTQFATRMTFDGESVAINSTQTVTLTQATKKVNVQCVYDDPQWTSVADQKTYALTFERQIEIDMEHFSVALNISAEQGYCVMRPHMGKGHKERGFLCRFRVDKPNFMALISDKALQVVLEKGSTHSEHTLPAGLPVPVPVPKKRSAYTLKVLGSEVPLEYPVMTIHAGDCSTMNCPIGTIQRTDVMSIENTQAYLCENEHCTKKDTNRCCKEAPKCHTMEYDEFKCPAGHHFSLKRSCHHEPCSEHDLAHCCIKGAEPERHHEHHGQKNWKLRRHLHHLIRHKMEWYRRVGCGPTAERFCNGNLCYYDETCVWTAQGPPRLGGFGCYAGGIAMHCRYCDFGPYESCPRWFDCTGPCHAWTEAHHKWCYKYYNVHCPKWLHHVDFWQNSTVATAVLEGGSSSMVLAGVALLAAAAVALMAVWRSDFRARWQEAMQPGMRDMMIMREQEPATSLAE